MVVYVANDMYLVSRLHCTCIMLPNVPFNKIKTPGFSLGSVPFRELGSGGNPNIFVC